jgi:Zn-dependent protease
MSLPVRLLLYFVPMLLSLTVHECCHALAAHWLGDDTAKERGRLTLNPIPHIDLFGTILLPALAIAGHGPVFGWARPTPINAARFRQSVSFRFGIAFTSIVGPISNLVLGLAAALLLSGFRHSGSTLQWVEPLLLATMSINAALAIFNFLPIPPLDGSNLVLGLLPRNAAIVYARLGRWSPLLLIALFLVPAIGQTLAIPMQGLLAFYETVAAL